MADLVSLDGWRMYIEKGNDLNFLLSKAIEVSKKTMGKINGEIFIPDSGIGKMLTSKFNQVLLEEKIIDREIFRCALYVSKIFEEILKEVPESYYGTDYWIREMQEENPVLFKKGGDVCFLVCTFFEKYARRRTSMGDFQRMGSFLYDLYYSQTDDTIGWCMSNNFKNILQIAQEGIRLL